MTHPIVLPPHIEIKLIDEAPRFHDSGAVAARERWLIQRAAQLGADQELEACCEWLENEWIHPKFSDELRAARRPKPLSLKQQALDALDSFEGFTGSLEEVDIIRRALESLPDSQD